MLSVFACLRFSANNKRPHVVITDTNIFIKHTANLTAADQHLNQLYSDTYRDFALLYTQEMTAADKINTNDTEVTATDDKA